MANNKIPKVCKTPNWMLRSKGKRMGKLESGDKAADKFVANLLERLKEEAAKEVTALELSLKGVRDDAAKKLAVVNVPVSGSVPETTGLLSDEEVRARDAARNALSAQRSSLEAARTAVIQAHEAIVSGNTVCMQRLLKMQAHTEAKIAQYVSGIRRNSGFAEYEAPKAIVTEAYDKYIEAHKALDEAIRAFAVEAWAGKEE